MKKLLSLIALATSLLIAPMAHAAFTATVTEITIFGSKLVKYGSYANTSGSTGGEVVTNLNAVQYCQLQPLGSSAIATQSVINETFPLINSTGTVTIVTSADESGLFMCFGY